MTKRLYAIATFADPDLAATLLTTLGFTETLIVRDPADDRTVHHAEFRWSDGGGLMWATPDPDRVWRRPGTGNVYLALDSGDDVDRLHARLTELGCTSVEEPNDQRHGGRGGGVRDPEGNLWSFGTYPGAAETAGTRD